ncbi:MAG: methylenetetrahydrofolate--tRNA-(uracil(54)-C(5))-methyltransferase (FADH(2)-oxidizing) TrmFO [Atopobiaceae bacterium]|nr:methylenetetrahydrofolate--tRNA-(uracil(54)-C(5))-methyltransferase (FADH(2)-oxidizing) TrmFO [Atopobiaceae bacterium]
MAEVSSDERVCVIGAGLAGSECALQLALRGIPVTLVEQRPVHSSPAHHTDRFAELVCSNSLKATRAESAAGLLKVELDAMGCRLLDIARRCAVPAGGALAVDRDAFSQAVTDAIENEPLIDVVRREATSIPEGRVVIAAGPLCSNDLFSSIADLVGGEHLSFFDAAAPIVEADSLDRTVIFEQSRYGEEGEGDYLNCPMTKEEYEAFWEALVGADRVISKDFERSDLFQACQPAEEIARKGRDALRFGALKPVGLVDPRTGRRPWAAVQLRAENAERTAYNLVGFQTNLTWGEQARVFRMIPGLGEATFARYGVMHRNSFVDAPRVLDPTFAVPGTTVRLAGQITGTEGYVEAIASGLLAAANTAADMRGLAPVQLPRTTSLGSLVAYATDPATSPYQPMHVNFGIIAPLGGGRMGKRERYRAYAERGVQDLGEYLGTRTDLFPHLDLSALELPPFEPRSQKGRS